MQTAFEAVCEQKKLRNTSRKQKPVCVPQERSEPCHPGEEKMGTLNHRAQNSSFNQQHEMTTLPKSMALLLLGDYHMNCVHSPPTWGKS